MRRQVVDVRNLILHGGGWGLDFRLPPTGLTANDRQVQQSKRIGGSLMATYVSPAIEQIADYAEATRGWFYGPLRDFIGGRGRIVL